MSAITCARCGVPAQRSGGRALYCLPCTHTKRSRVAEPGRMRNGVFSRLMGPTGWVCVDCKAPVPQAVYGGKKRSPPMRCTPCRRKRDAVNESIRNQAASAVASAVRVGLLLPATVQRCVDCNKPAACYDHRDYTKPLHVDPVCRSCNVMRGPADVWKHPAPADSTPEPVAAAETGNV